MAVHKLKECLIITFDTEKTLDKDGKKIRVVPAWKWMWG
jgi:predicted AAA+ superfamily ATPase